jgi:hypothetical protein
LAEAADPHGLVLQLKRVRQSILRVVLVAPAVFFAALWVLSTFASVSATYPATDEDDQTETYRLRCFAFDAARGLLGVMVATDTPQDAQALTDAVWAVARTPRNVLTIHVDPAGDPGDWLFTSDTPSSWERHGFALSRPQWAHLDAPRNALSAHAVVVPAWFAWMIASLPLGMVYSLRLARRWRRARLARAGHCPVCGYDLRGVPGRCPECGHPAGDAIG